MLRIAALLLALATVTIACIPNSAGGNDSLKDSMSDDAIADTQCSAIAEGVVGLQDWIAKVMNAHAIVTPIGLAYEDLFRSDGYELLELSYSFEPIGTQLQSKAAEIRQLGGGCIAKYDAVMHMGENLPVLGAAFVSCTIPQDQYKASLWTCPTFNLTQWRDRLVMDKLSEFDSPISAPTPEYLANLKPWNSGSNDNVGLSENLSSVRACQTASGFVQASPGFWFNFVAGEDYRAESIHRSPLSIMSSSDTGPVHQLWEVDNKSDASDASFGYFNAFANAAARRIKVAADLQRLLIEAMPATVQLCSPVTAAVEKLIGSSNVKVPKNGTGNGSMGNVIEAFIKCGDKSFQEMKAKELGDPLIDSPGMCLRRLYWGGFKVVSEHYVDVMDRLAGFSYFRSVSEDLQQ